MSLNHGESGGSTTPWTRVSVTTTATDLTRREGNDHAIKTNRMVPKEGRIERREMLGGAINGYRRAA
ncbi:hypothetical protein [Nonomuraea dietziae]|uniref:hypothetical protein n=1 Tax=Nonomuraea dietziae TaxID=65515 RepID=UPI0031D36383